MLMWNLSGEVGLNELREIKMNLKSLEILFNQAYVPYKIDKDNEWLEGYGNGQLVAPEEE